MTEISVIIPNLNKEKYIRRAMESVMDQMFMDFELIVVDGKSTDRSMDFIRAFTDKRVRAFVQPATGVSNARNFGVSQSKGSLVAFLDADDEWASEHLSTIMELRQEFPGAGMYATLYLMQEKNGLIIRPNLVGVPKERGLIQDYFKSAVSGDFPVWTGTVCIPKNIYEEMHGFPEGYWWGEDADLFARIAMKYPVAFSSYVGGVYHRDAEGRMGTRPSTRTEPVVLTINNHKDATVDMIEYANRKELYRAACLMYCGEILEAREVLRKTDTQKFKVQKRILQTISLLPYSMLRRVLKVRFGFE